jgi:type IV pilus assembly protein PilB
MAISDETLISAGIQTGLIDAPVLDRLRIDARRQRTAILPLILAQYRFPTSALYRAVAEVNGLDYIDLSSRKPHAELLKKVPTNLIKRKQILPIVDGDNAQLVISDPNDRATIDSILRLMATNLPLVMADINVLRLMIERALPSTTSTESQNDDESEVDLVALLDSIIREAYLNQASDIHFVTEEEGLRVRLRIDGKLRDHPVDANALVAAGLVSRVKVLSGLDIAETRQPQDGGFSYHLAPPIDREFNVRVATAPTRLGERITMRLLGQESGGLSLTDLGMLAGDLAHFKIAIKSPYGLILLTGPTGSGKSTTLFAALQEINDPEINIMTVENPIEYVMEGVSQIQTGHKISFADALRSLLRHDPDVLMVGEIRDHETADVSVKAAMTGHLVFSTLHTNNAVSAVTRLIDIGCEAFLIASTLTAVIAQRLVRRLCHHCRKPRLATTDERSLLGASDEDVTIYDSVGCAVCQGRGYRGRLGLFETLWLDERLSRFIAQGADEDKIEAEAGDKLKFMWEDGCEKVLNGMTTLDELRNVAIHKTHAMVEAH